MQVETLFFLVILIFSIILHEISHGYVAEMLGDKTARHAGRLTLDPRPHIDPMGSIIIPALLLLGSKGSFAFGWAKPVPYNPYNLRNYKWGSIAVASAGVLMNLMVALIFGLILRFYVEIGITSQSFLEIVAMITQLNLVLAVFNLIPFPPLDGSKILFALLPSRYQHIHDYLEQNWLLFIVFVLLLAQYILPPIVSVLFGAITGIHLGY